MEPLRIHIGGCESKPGWKILNIQPGDEVDYVASCTELAQLFGDGTVAEVYASHVLEHLSYNGQLSTVLSAIYRILVPGGLLRVSVPNLDVLCRLFVHPEVKPQQRFEIMRMMFGGQMDDFDFHKVGLSWEILAEYVRGAGFSTMQQVDSFDLFHDDSTIQYLGHRISLNVEITK